MGEQQTPGITGINQDIDPPAYIQNKDISKDKNRNNAKNKHYS
jgi:hypothetical protein